MSTGQYRALIAYLSFWPKTWDDFSFDGALQDIGISLTKDEVLHELFIAGWNWDDEKGTMSYDVD